MNPPQLLKIACLLLLFALPAVVQAQFTFTTNNDGSLNIYQYIGSGGVVVIPSTTNGYPITSIGNQAFENKLALNSVMIGTNVTSIGIKAFFQCIQLTNITIPNSVTNIGTSAFQYCHFLKNITIPNSVTSIGEEAFLDCASLTSVIIPNSVTSIGNETFMICSSLTNVIIPDSVTSIGIDAFDSCTSLISITIPSSVNNLTSLAFQSCTNLQEVYFEGNTPSDDGTEFYDDNVTHVTVYYLPGTTGWGLKFGGATTVLWNPQAQTGDGSFGVQNNQFGFNIAGTSGLVIVVEACTNLANPVWQPIQTNTLTGGSSYFSDPQWTNYPCRFYGFSWP